MLELRGAGVECWSASVGINTIEELLKFNYCNQKFKKKER